MSIPIQQAYLHCPRCGGKHDDPGRVPFRCDRCQFAVFFGPVAAVGGLIVDSENKLLLVRRARNPGKGQWGLPGGFVDSGESVEDALAREVYEETRLRLKRTELLITSPNQYDYQGIVTQVIDLFYVCRAVDPTTVILEPAELDDYAWVNPTADHLDNMAFESNRIAIEHWMG
ncbi:Nucleoside triphosphatase NudI [Stieleria maiorica]|uniref:Nucleoside triphosphatase NudI n=1 Tax=Stieleria maiorica TaxID=2795974 RepID=A0A5B9MBG8_9BACT|nr:NUDIX domain-containing protein [Stieleria maiorica]QEF96875.1 Nucleoside triphosphatase NudI [Stieleria maiorica]